VVRDPVDLGLAVRVGPMDRAGLGLAVRVGLVVPLGRDLVRVDLGRVAPADLPLVGLVDRVARVDRMGPAALVGLDRMDLAAPVGLARVGLVAPVDRAGLGLAVRVGLGVPVARVDRMGPAALVGLDRMDLAAPVVPNMVARVDLDRVGRAAPVVPVVPVVPNMVGPVAPADRHRPRMCNAVTTTVVARSGVDRGMRRTASARPITARRPRHGKTDSGGTVDLLRERRHPTGTGHRLLAAGTGRRPLVAGIPIGTGPDAI
jgi:hypothetical protein